MRDLRGGLVRTTVALLLGSAVLSGCAEKQEASTTLPTTEAAPTSGLPALGPADFPVPDEARTKDAAGAEAFLRYWIELLNRQRAIPSGDALRDLGPECQNCQRIAHNYDEAAAAGYRYEGGDVTINALAEPDVEGDEVIISFGARREPVTLLEADGSVIDAQSDVAPNLGSGIILLWSEPDRSWMVRGFDLG
ncbi:hypothetical protein [Blastococcus sp. SYSU DS0973]